MALEIDIGLLSQQCYEGMGASMVTGGHMLHRAARNRNRTFGLMSVMAVFERLVIIYGMFYRVDH